MPAKVAKATKDLAYQKLRDGLGNKEIAELTGLSLRSVGRMKSMLEGKSAMPARNARKSQGQPVGNQAMPQTGNDEDRTTLDFEESPEPIEQKSVIDSAMDSLKAMLGIKESKSATPIVVSAKLNAKQQQFVDAVSPTVALAAISIAAYMWSRIGTEYAILAPDETVARKIVEPIVRIYARHANFMMDVNPDFADAGASLLALVGYVHISLKLYQEIKADKEYEAQEGFDPANARRNYRAAPAEPESRDSHTSNRHADVQQQQQRNRANDSVDSGDGGYPVNFNLSALSDKEARQHEALSRLSQLDYQHRARRSGRN